MEAGRILGVGFNELKAIIDEEHFKVFEMTIEERRKTFKEKPSFDETHYDIPTWVRKGKKIGNMITRTTTILVMIEHPACGKYRFFDTDVGDIGENPNGGMGSLNLKSATRRFEFTFLLFLVQRMGRFR